MKVSMSRTKSIGILILVSTVVLCGAVLPVSALTPPPNWFLGDVTLNGEPAPTGITIEAFIQGDSRGNVTVESPGKYANLGVVGDSADNNMPITFTVDGLPANEEGIWIAWITTGAQILNLTAGDAPAGDITYPNITITTPKSGASFTTETITVIGTASDNEGVSKVEVRVGSGDWIDASGTTSWSITVTLDLGPKTIYARANDTSGNSREVQVDDVRYVGEGSETTPPTVSIDSPSGGDTFTTETITVSGTASDNEGVSKVEVRVGSGDWIDASGNRSWSKTVTLVQGMNTIDVRAIDDTGNPSETASVTVARNSPGSVPPSSGGISGGRVVATGATSTENGTQAESRETAESGTSEPTTTGMLTSAATDAKKSDANSEENQGLLPGFEAMFAIAGLLAVIYLIRRV